MASCGLDGSLAEMECDQVHECSEVSEYTSLASSHSTHCSPDSSISQIPHDDTMSQISTTRSYHDQQGVLDFWYTNATSLNNKIRLLESVAASLEPNVIGITETWFDSSSASELDGYKLFRTDRNGDKRGGGVCIYVNSCVKAFAASNESFLDTDCEQIWVTINLNEDKPLLVGCIYRPPPQSKTNHPSCIDIGIVRSLETAKRLLNSKDISSVILMGDFNLPDIEWNEFGAPVLASDSSTSAYISSAIGYSSFEQLVTSKTFANSGNLSSLLDLVLVSDQNRMSEVELGPPLDTSVTRSHFSLRFRLFARVERTQAFDSRRYNWRNGDYESMNKFFKEFNWSAHPILLLCIRSANDKRSCL